MYKIIKKIYLKKQTENTHTYNWMQSTPMLFLSYIYSLVLYCVLCYTGCIHIVYFKFVVNYDLAGIYVVNDVED